MPKSPKPREVPEPTPDTFSPLEGISELFEDLTEEQKILHRMLISWTKHPLGEAMDDAEEIPKGGKDRAAPVDRASMERRIREILSKRPAAVHLVRSSEDLKGPKGAKEVPSWLVVVGDGEELATALEDLKKKVARLSPSDIPFRDVVLWVRRWDAAVWERLVSEGLGALEERPLWLKPWNASGSLLGDFRFVR